MNEKRSTYRSGRIRGRFAVVFCLMLAAVLLPALAFAAPRTISDVSATYLNSASITLSATGANATFCQLDTGAVSATTSVTTSVYGPHVLAFWSTDTSGAVEATCKAPFFVDEDVPPVIVCDAVDSYICTASITMTATDNFNGSGVDFVCYRVDGGAYMTALSPASVAATKLLTARLAKVEIGPTVIDPPVDPTLPPPHADRGPCVTCHDLIVTNPEPTSTPGPVITMSPSVTVTGIGAHTLEYWSQDIARNATVHVTRTFTIEAAPQVTFKIDASAGPNGGITHPGSLDVVQGDDVTYTFTPASGFKVDTLVVDGVALPAATSYTFTDVQAAHQIAVTFAATVVPPYSTALTMKSDRTTSTHGHTVKFSGHLLPSSAPAGRPITVWLRKAGHSWVKLTTVSTSASDLWAYTLHTSTRSHGTYYVRVKYAGDSTCLSCSSAYKTIHIK